MQLDRHNANSPSRFVLVGFMGAGKSTVGALLAQRLGWRFADSDHRIEQKTGMRIADLFSALGEPEFRRIEEQVIAELLEEEELVLALGGGAMESESTRRMIAEASDTRVVFLKAPLEILIERCERQPDAAIRPVLKQRNSLDRRFQARQRHYESAHVIVETHGVSPAAVVDHILGRFQPDCYRLPVAAKAETL